MTLPSWVDLPAYFPDPQHRVWLRRRLKGAGPPVAFILHNPSTAGAGMEDATSRRGIGFANAWGCSDLVFVNVATGIATDARDLDAIADPFRMYLEAIRAAFDFVLPRGGKVVAAWGAPKGRTEVRRSIADRAAWVRYAHRGALNVLRLTPSGYPEHPLYLPRHLVPIPWE